jgi:hypothetical protein
MDIHSQNQKWAGNIRLSEPVPFFANGNVIGISNPELTMEEKKILQSMLTKKKRHINFNRNY